MDSLSLSHLEIRTLTSSLSSVVTKVDRVVSWVIARFILEGAFTLHNNRNWGWRSHRHGGDGKQVLLCFVLIHSLLYSNRSLLRLFLKSLFLFFIYSAVRPLVQAELFFKKNNRNCISFSIMVITLSGHATLHCIETFIFQLMLRKRMRKGKEPTIIFRYFRIASPVPI